MKLTGYKELIFFYSNCSQDINLLLKVKNIKDNPFVHLNDFNRGLSEYWLIYSI